MTHTHTFCRTPLDERLARRNIHKRQTAMPPAGFEPAIPASKQILFVLFSEEKTCIKYLQLKSYLLLLYIQPCLTKDCYRQPKFLNL
jgi:hypothetical protein